MVNGANFLFGPARGGLGSDPGAPLRATPSVCPVDGPSDARQPDANQ